MHLKDRRSKRDTPSTENPGSQAAGTPSAAPAEAPAADLIFLDRRSGVDRREAQGRTYDARRSGIERRRSNVTPSSWWLDKSYVDTHHFSDAMPAEGSAGPSYGA
jgi:hypothetical protein